MVIPVVAGCPSGIDVFPPGQFGEASSAHPARPVRTAYQACSGQTVPSKLSRATCPEQVVPSKLQKLKRLAEAGFQLGSEGAADAGAGAVLEDDLEFPMGQGLELDDALEVHDR